MPQVTLKSGLIVDVRKLHLRDENTLVSAKGGSRKQIMEAIDSVLSSCIISIIDPGPYAYLQNDEAKISWLKTLSGDKIKLMLELRQASYTEGNKIFIPDVKCDHCKDVFGWEVEIDKDLKEQGYPADSIALFATGEPMSGTIAGKTIKFSLATGATDKKTQELTIKHGGKRDMAAMFAGRIISVEGIDPSEIMDWIDGNNGTSKKFEGLSSDEGEDFRDMMDCVDGGIDLEVKAKCTLCGTETKFSIPFDTIFMPARKIQKRRAAASIQ